jgi:hypothetical protein
VTGVQTCALPILFPGWRKSFREGLKYARKNSYDRIVFIESDLYIRKKFINRFKELFDKDGYFAGYDRKYRMMETSLQILNNKNTVNTLIDLFESKDNLYTSTPTEYLMKRVAHPKFLKEKGIRVEGGVKKMSKWMYYAQSDFNKHKDYILN